MHGGSGVSFDFGCGHRRVLLGLRAHRGDRRHQPTSTSAYDAVIGGAGGRPRRGQARRPRPRGRRGLPSGHRRRRLRRVVPPPHRSLHRARRARVPVHQRGGRDAARGGHDVHDRAVGVLARTGRRAHRGHRGRHRDGGVKLNEYSSDMVVVDAPSRRRRRMLSDEVRDFIAERRIRHADDAAPDGRPAAQVMWIDCDDECVLINTSCTARSSRTSRSIQQYVSIKVEGEQRQEIRIAEIEGR